MLDSAPRDNDQDAPRRYYTLAEANGLIPRLQTYFHGVMQLRAQLKTIYRRLEDKDFAPTTEDFEVWVKGAPPEVIRDRAKFKALVAVLREQLASIQETGCEIKDMEIGLVDWPSTKDGEDIFLCWRYGEPEVLFWHDRQSGYAGRRPVSELI